MIEHVINLTLYALEGEQDRFKVTTIVDGEVVDVTEQYEVLAAATEDGRQGFGVFRTQQAYGPAEPNVPDEDPPEVKGKSYLVRKDGSIEEFEPRATGKILPPPVVDISVVED